MVEKKKKMFPSQMVVRSVIALTCASMGMGISIGIDKKISALKKAAIECVGAHYRYEHAKMPMVAGYKAVGKDQLFLDGDIYNLRVLRYDIKGSQEYMDQRDGFDQFLSKEHRDPDVAIRAAATNYVIENMKKVDDVALKATLINGFVNKAFRYDELKADGNIWFDLHDYWDQSPQMTVTAGQGVCVDQAKLKAEMLLRAGVPSKDLLLLSLKNDKGGPRHQVVRIDAGDYGPLILNNGGFLETAPEATYLKDNPDWSVTHITDMDGKSVLVDEVSKHKAEGHFKSLDDIPYEKYRSYTNGPAAAAQTLEDKYGDDKIPHYSGSWKHKPGDAMSFDAFYKKVYRDVPSAPEKKAMIKYHYVLNPSIYTKG